MPMAGRFQFIPNATVRYRYCRETHLFPACCGCRSRTAASSLNAPPTCARIHCYGLFSQPPDLRPPRARSLALLSCFPAHPAVRFGPSATRCRSARATAQATTATSSGSRSSTASRVPSARGCRGETAASEWSWFVAYGTPPPPPSSVVVECCRAFGSAFRSLQLCCSSRRNTRAFVVVFELCNGWPI